MSDSSYPHLEDFLAGWFHQDFDLEGDTVTEVVAAYQAVAPQAERSELRREVVAFLNNHAADELAAAFERSFRLDILPAELSGSTRAFLEAIRDGL